MIDKIKVKFKKQSLKSKPVYELIKVKFKKRDLISLRNQAIKSTSVKFHFSLLNRKAEDFYIRIKSNNLLSFLMKISWFRILKGFNESVYSSFYHYVLRYTSYRHVNYRGGFIRNRILNLNFRHNRFFPSVRSFFRGNVYTTLSLGLFSKFFFKPKCFTKSKTVYLTVAAFLRKILLYCSFPHLYLFINKTPKYFNEILAKINEPAISFYKNPFPNPGKPENLVNESENHNNFSFSGVMFFNNKKFGLVKMRKRGRLKRKIYRRLVVANRVLD